MTRARDVADVQDNLGGAVPPFVAGKNKIINGDFGIWQRGTSFTPMSNAAYGPDRWQFGLSGDVANVTRQAFTPNDIASIGYGDAQFFMRMEVVSSNGSARVEQKIEDVRTLADQSVTVSFWAKANTNTSLDVVFVQNFGSGGSTQVDVTAQVVALTTSWQRFTKTFSIPTLSGKTIGAGSYLALALRETSASTNVTFDFWGVQVEAGSVATPFTTATGTIQGELAACRRYCKSYVNTVSGSTYIIGSNVPGIYQDADILNQMLFGYTCSDMRDRAALTLTLNGVQGTDWGVYTSSGAVQTGFTLTVLGDYLRMTKTSHGLTNTNLRIITTSGALIISNEL